MGNIADFSTIIIITGISITVILVLVASILVMWKKVPQDKAGVVTGARKRVITGGGGFVIPLIERIDFISLENMQVTATVNGLTSTGVPVRADSITVLKIQNKEESILAAMEQFNVGNLNETIKNIRDISQEVVEGKLREIMSNLSVEDLYKDRDKFAGQVQEVAAMDLGGMGLEVKTFTIKDISDSEGYIQALGKARTAEVKKNADIAESEALSQRDIAVADADKKSAVEVAIRRQETEEAKSAAEIKISEAHREKELKLQEIRIDTEKKKATADKAYEIEANKTQQLVVESELAIETTRQRKQIEVVEALAAVKKKEEEQETEIAKQRALRTAEELQSEVQKKAEAEANKVKTEAEADLFRRQKEADAKKYEEISRSESDAAVKERQAQADAESLIKEADAKKIAEISKSEAEAFSKERQAAAEAESINKMSEAEAAAIKSKGMAEAEAESAIGRSKAESIKAQGLAEAEVIKQKALAEAEGKKVLAEAYKEFGDAAMAQMFINVLPEITKPVAEAVSSAIAQVDGITIIDNGKGENSSTQKLTNMATTVLTEVPTAVKAVTGIDLQAMLQNFAAMSGGFPLDEKNDTKTP